MPVLKAMLRGRDMPCMRLMRVKLAVMERHRSKHADYKVLYRQASLLAPLHASYPTLIHCGTLYTSSNGFINASTVRCQGSLHPAMHDMPWRAHGGMHETNEHIGSQTTQCIMTLCDSPSQHAKVYMQTN